MWRMMRIRWLFPRDYWDASWAQCELQLQRPVRVRTLRAAWSSRFRVVLSQLAIVEKRQYSGVRWRCLQKRLVAQSFAGKAASVASAGAWSLPRRRAKHHMPKNRVPLHQICARAHPLRPKIAWHPAHGHLDPVQEWWRCSCVMAALGLCRHQPRRHRHCH
jgi:hypothetical protein